MVDELGEPLSLERVDDRLVGTDKPGFAAFDGGREAVQGWKDLGCRGCVS